MNIYDDMIPLVIQTRDGNKNISDVTVGDVVYGFTGEEYTVYDIVTFDKEDVYRVVYSDNRESFYRLSDLIFMGSYITNIQTIMMEKINDLRNNALEKKTIGSITHYPIDYARGKALNPLNPDPYLAGAFFIYGDTDDEYLNLPLDSPAVHAHLFIKHRLDYGERLGSNKVYFKRNLDRGNRLIRWEALFKDISLSEIKDSIIPEHYIRSSINDRWQLIRGIFDAGYNKITFPYTCSISSDSEDKLKVVQRVLWSLGILSLIIYDPNLELKENHKFRLDVKSHQLMLPDFFYHIDFKEKMLRNQLNKRIGYYDYNIYIKSIEKYGSAFSRTLVFDKPRRLYLTDNFIPRVSL